MLPRLDTGQKLGPYVADVILMTRGCVFDRPYMRPGASQQFSGKMKLIGWSQCYKEMNKSMAIKYFVF